MSESQGYKKRSRSQNARIKPHSRPQDDIEKTWRAEMLEREKGRLVMQMQEMAGVGRPLIFEYPSQAMIELVEAGVAKRVGNYGFTLVGER